jgi:hypothetical protein
MRDVGEGGGMRCKTLSVASLLIALCACWAAAPWASGAPSEAASGWLISPAEAIQFRGEDGFNAEPPIQPRGIGPVIDILKPAPARDLKVKAPFAISVRFNGLSDSPIDPKTFKVMYGFLKIDITNRIIEHVSVAPEGFALENAQIPPGKHSLVLQVSDGKKRVATRELRFEVE